jgi:hypothetical protein
MDIVTREKQKWPHPTKGPFDLWTTIGLVSGRAQVVGVELWAVDPVELEKTLTGRSVTGLTRAMRQRVWPPVGDTKWQSREGVIRSKDLRIALSKVVIKIMSRQKVLAKAVLIDGMYSKSARVLNPKLPPGYRHPLDTERARRGARLVVEASSDEGVTGARKGGRPRLPLSEYVEVVQIYEKARAKGLNPIQAIVDQKHVSKSWASGIIFKSRRPPLNLLPPTNRGVALSAPVIEIATSPRKTRKS